MYSSRGSNATRYWVSGVALFCVFYWILRVEQHTSRVTSPWRSRFQPQSPAIVTHSGDAFAEDGSDSMDHLPITKTHPQSPSPLSVEFPKLIWQTSNTEGVEQWANQTATWTDKNPEWEYNLLTDEGATAFVYEHFRHRPSIIQFWSSLRQVVLKADLIRYLAMLARGGVYSDMDTSCLVPIDDWIPVDMRNKTINAVVGIEYDDTTYRMFVRPISFNQWTLMAKPGHAIFETAVRRVMSNLEYIARRKRVLLTQLTLEKMEVLEATGPGMITDAVLEVLRDQVENIRWDTFHHMKQPKLFGDVLILPVRAFAGGQKHSNSSDKAFGPALVQHHFGRSWYKPQAPLPVPAQNETTVEAPMDKAAELAADLEAERTSEQMGETEGGTGGEKGEHEHEEIMPDEVVPETATEKIEKLDTTKIPEQVDEEEEGGYYQAADEADSDKSIEESVDEVEMNGEEMGLDVEVGGNVSASLGEGEPESTPDPVEESPKGDDSTEQNPKDEDSTEEIPQGEDSTEESPKGEDSTAGD